MAQKDNRARSLARLAAVQALYQMEATSAGVETVILEFEAHRLGGDLDGVGIHEADSTLFGELVRGVVGAQRRIDPFIERQLAEKWTLSRLDATARAILRAGVYEMTMRPETPFKVVIDEYVEIANAFFGGPEPQFINAVLDAAARETRSDEFAQGA
ncbi:MAG: transcription antitermination factor NusB [Pseudomonadota bacterium]|nr:transcription antitermination factor NusB [Pseudomonadota bacterium]